MGVGGGGAESGPSGQPRIHMSLRLGVNGKVNAEIGAEKEVVVAREEVAYR